MVTGINQECVFTAVNWEDDSFIRAEDEDHEYFMEYIEKFGEMGTEVYLLEYTTDEALAAEIQDYCSEKGFSCYIADSLELTEREKTTFESPLKEGWIKLFFLANCPLQYDVDVSGISLWGKSLRRGF